MICISLTSYGYDYATVPVCLKGWRSCQQIKNRGTTIGDIPEEFLDPILGTVMNDPVTLPNSQVTLDRTSIVRHLLRYVFTII